MFNWKTPQTKAESKKKNDDIFLNLIYSLAAFQRIQPHLNRVRIDKVTVGQKTVDLRFTTFM